MFTAQDIDITIAFNRYNEETYSRRIEGASISLKKDGESVDNCGTFGNQKSKSKTNFIH